MFGNRRTSQPPPPPPPPPPDEEYDDDEMKPEMTLMERIDLSNPRITSLYKPTRDALSYDFVGISSPSSNVAGPVAESISRLVGGRSSIAVSFENVKLFDICVILERLLRDGMMVTFRKIFFDERESTFQPLCELLGSHKLGWVYVKECNMGSNVQAFYQNLSSSLLHMDGSAFLLPGGQSLRRQEDVGALFSAGNIRTIAIMAEYDRHISSYIEEIKRCLIDNKSIAGVQFVLTDEPRDLSGLHDLITSTKHMNPATFKGFQVMGSRRGQQEFLMKGIDELIVNTRNEGVQYAFALKFQKDFEAEAARALIQFSGLSPEFPNVGFHTQ